MRKITVPINQPQCYCPTIVWIDGEPYAETMDMVQQANGVVFVRNKIYTKFEQTQEPERKGMSEKELRDAITEVKKHEIKNPTVKDYFNKEPKCMRCNDNGCPVCSTWDMMEKPAKKECNHEYRHCDCSKKDSSLLKELSTAYYRGFADTEKMLKRVEETARKWAVEVVEKCLCSHHKKASVIDGGCDTNETILEVLERLKR